MSRFQDVVAKPDFPAMEREILAWWTQEGIMQAYLKRNEGAPERYGFIDGPTSLGAGVVSARACCVVCARRV